MSKVKVYVTPTCPFCRMTLEWMKKFNVEHEVVVFTNVNDKIAFYKTANVSTVPQIYVDGTRIGGWSDLVKSEFKKQIEANAK